MTKTSTSSSRIGQVGKTSICMDESGGPWRGLGRRRSRGCELVNDRHCRPPADAGGSLLPEHDLVRKPVPIFRDHDRAVGGSQSAAGLVAVQQKCARRRLVPSIYLYCGPVMAIHGG